MRPAPGFLAIWSDIAPQEEADYLHWLTREHTAERVGIDGFLGVRVFRALRCDVRRYFILYELASADVVDSPAYLARLNAPTPWSGRIMPKLGGFLRGGGRLERRAGRGSGGVVAVCRLATQDATAAAREQVPGLGEMDGICAARALAVDQGRTGVETREKSLRSGDDGFAGLLVIEGMDRAAVEAARDRTGLDGDVYAQVFSLAKDAVVAEAGAR